MDESFYLRLAENEAWKYQGLTYPNPAVGCCVVSACGKILAVEAHHKAGFAHAEVNALAKAYIQLTQDETILELLSSHEIHSYLLKNHNNIFEKCTLYVTLEPCSNEGKTPSCALLIQALGIEEVVIASPDSNPQMAEGSKLLKKHRFLPSKSSDALITPFNLWQDERFVTFKWAQRLDGTIDATEDGDKIVSSKTSREFVHKMRDVSDLIVIGGNTVREDRPTLDARMVAGKAPDLLIYSRKKDFDRTIPLFSVEGREVIISDSLDIVQKYSNVLIEGGPNMFEVTKDIVDYYLCFVSLKSGGKMPFIKDAAAFELLHQYHNGYDNVMWLKLEKEK